MENKTIVITGTSSGVGESIKMEFMRAGWWVYTIGGREVVDISNDLKVDLYFDALLKIPIIDVLVNNAGVFLNKPFADCTIPQINKIIDTNLKGTIHVTQRAIERMKPGSRIINIGSVAGTHGIKNQAVYCASKYGLNGFFEALQPELMERGILCTTINPGGIDTPLWNTRNPYSGDRKKLLTPADIASLVWYIANLPAHVVFKNATIYPTNENH